MINFFLIMGGIWLALTLGEPIVAYMDAIHECDLKYATDRRRRAEVYEELNALHRESELFRQMQKEKAEKQQVSRKPSPNNSKTRRAKRRRPKQAAYAEKQRRIKDAGISGTCSAELLE